MVRLFQNFVVVVSAALVLSAPSAALGQVTFPLNPKTSAECDGPARQQRALQDALSEQHGRKYRETEAADFASGAEKYRALMTLIDVQSAESDKLRQEHRALEDACRAAARKNETVAQQTLRELKEGYEQAKRAYDRARALLETIRSSPDNAYVKRNQSHSPELEGQMNTAKRYILEFQSRSEIIGAIQDASFNKLKSEVQQLNGDINQLESSIQSIRSDDLAATPSASQPGVVLQRRPGGAGSSLFENAISQSEQAERDRVAREAREKAGRERLAEQQRLAGTQRTAPAPAPTPQPSARDRLIAGLDQRIASARQQCLSSESSCNTGCVGIGAIGIFSALSGNRAAATATQDQLQQCSNRCDQEKSDCDQQVAALEQEKSQALAGPSISASGASITTPQAGPASDPRKVCAAEITRVANSRQAFQIKGNENFLKVTCSDTNYMRNRLAQNERSMASDLYRSDPDSRAFFEMVICFDRALLRQCASKQQEAGTKTASAGDSHAACAATPQESFRNFDGEMRGFGGRYPNQSSRGGSRDQYQYSLFYGSSGLQILEKYRSCLSAADYQANKRALEDMRDKGRQGCEQLSTSQGSCTASYPANWR